MRIPERVWGTRYTRTMDPRDTTPDPDRPQPPRYRRAGDPGRGAADDPTEVFGAQGRHSVPEDRGTRQFDPVPDPYPDVPPSGAYPGPRPGSHPGQRPGRPPVPVPSAEPPSRRGIGGVWTAVILLLFALVALLAFFLWLNDRGPDGRPSTTVTRTSPPSATVAPSQTPTPSEEPTAPGFQLPTELPDLPELPSDLPALPTELPDREQLDQWRTELGDRFNDFMDDLNSRTGN